MKKIINNRVYDTEKAVLVGSSCCRESAGNPNYVKEKLYRKRTGEYFLYGVGGPNTQYAKLDGYSIWKFGERLVPVTYSVAKNWAETNLSDYVYSEHFEVDKGDETKSTVTVSLRKSDIDKLKIDSAAHGMGVSAWVTKIINENN